MTKAPKKMNIQNEALLSVINSIIDEGKEVDSGNDSSYRISLTLGGEEGRERLRFLAEHYGVSASAVIRMLIMKDFRRLKKAS